MSVERFNELGRFSAKIGYRFCDPKLLARALRHVSMAAPGGLDSSQRLEFLGDSVLDLMVGEDLMLRYPNQREGFLSQRRAEIVCARALAERAREIRLGQLLEVKSEYLRQVDSVLADAMEALVGATYTDGGMPAARTVARKVGII